MIVTLSLKRGSLTIQVLIGRSSRERLSEKFDINFATLHSEKVRLAFTVQVFPP